MLWTVSCGSTTSGTHNHHNPQEEKEIGPEDRIGLNEEKHSVPEGRIEKSETRTSLIISEGHLGINITNSSLRTSRSPVKDLITNFQKLQQTENWTKLKSGLFGWRNPSKPKSGSAKSSSDKSKLTKISTHKQS